VAVVLALGVGAGSAFAAGPPVFKNGPVARSDEPISLDVEVTINPSGLVTSYVIEYATSEAGPWTAWAGGEIPASGISDGVNVTTVSRELHGGLSANTRYYNRVSATNADGTIVSGIVSVETTGANPHIESVTAADVAETSVHLNALIEPYEETEYRLEYATGEAGPWISVPGGSGTLPAANSFHSIPESILSGLSPDTVYYVHVLAKDKGGEGVVSGGGGIARFETYGPPTAETFAVHALDGETLRVIGSVVPNGFDTHYHFQYVTQGHFEAEGFANPAETSAGDAGSGGGSGVEPVTFGQDLPGLEPGVTYHFRLLATNTAAGNPVIYGEEQTLTVPVPGRVEAGEEEVAQPATCPNEAFRTGPSARLPDCRGYELVTPPDKGGAQDIFNYGAGGTTSIIGEDGDHAVVQTVAKWGSSPDNILSTYAFARGSAGWQMTSLTPQPEAGEETYRPDIFSPDLTQFALVTYTQTKFGPLGHSATQQFRVGPAGGPYTDVASTAFNQPEGGFTGDHWVGGSDDGSKLILRTVNHELLPGHPTGTVGAEAYDLYEYSGGQLRRLNVGPGGAPISTCGAELVHGFESYTGFLPKIFVDQLSSRHAVSADGDRVFFSDNCTHNLYMRVDGAETVDIGAYDFIAADPDGTKVLLEGQSGGGFFLYETESATVTPLPSTAGLHAEQQQFIVSEDLTAFYDGLGRYDIAAKTFTRVPQAELGTEGNGGGFSTTPDGRFFYFPAYRVGGVPGGNGTHVQVYRYDSVEKVIQCMSCASPFDPEPKLPSEFVPEGSQERTSNIVLNGAPLERISSDNGDYVFFDTPNALVPQDVNGEVPLNGEVPRAPDPGHSDVFFSESSDVYEWRKNGIDGCAHVQGCLSLITNGRNGSRNMLLGTTPSGHDVFFATHSQLVARDTDSAGDVYDARIGGGFAPPESPPVECEAAACSTPASPPNDVTPSSLTFSGAGNLLAEPPVAKAKAKGKAPRCAKGRTASHGRCVKAKPVKRKAKRGKRSRVVAGKGGAR
jgi:hypothetical protein